VISVDYYFLNKRFDDRKCNYNFINNILIFLNIALKLSIYKSIMSVNVILAVYRWFLIESTLSSLSTLKLTI